MEKEGLVVSSWETPERGAARRIYEITEEGQLRLGEWVVALERRIEALTMFVETYKKTKEASR